MLWNKEGSDQLLERRIRKELISAMAKPVPALDYSEY